MDEGRTRLTEWIVNRSEVTPDFEWFHGEHLHPLQSKAELRSSGLEGVLFGWKPDEPIIGPNTNVLALGSCFARYFIIWLGDQGFNRSFLQTPYEALIKFDFSFESVAVVAQQLRWAFGRFEPEHAFWIGKDRKRVHPTEEAKLLARDVLEKTEVLIITLGLSEIWYDRETNEPMWRAVPMSAYDPSRHCFKVLSVAETLACLEEIDSIRRAFLPNAKIIYTLSPIRLRATFRPVSAITANSASKAILRAALDEFFRAHWDEVNKSYFYFPSYEIVTELLEEAYCPDMRHVYEYVPEKVMALFAAHYTSLPQTGFQKSGDPSQSDLRQVVAELEAKVVELQRICDERMRVIGGLKSAADERLELIQRLNRELQLGRNGSVIGNEQ